MIVTCDTTRSKMVAPCDIRRPEDDDRATRSSHPPLPHHRNRKRQLPLQEQLSKSCQTRKGEISKLDERLTQKPSSSRVSSQWKSRVKSQRKSTVAPYVVGGALVDEDPDTVLGTQLLQGRELGRNFPFVFEAYKDIGINEELAAAAHSLRARVCVATHTGTIGAAQIQSACAAPSGRPVVQAGRVSGGQ